LFAAIGFHRRAAFSTLIRPNPLLLPRLRKRWERRRAEHPFGVESYAPNFPISAFWWAVARRPIFARTTWPSARRFRGGGSRKTPGAAFAPALATWSGSAWLAWPVRDSYLARKAWGSMTSALREPDGFAPANAQRERSPPTTEASIAVGGVSVLAPARPNRYVQAGESVQAHRLQSEYHDPDSHRQ
jgi:hypothetical protein